MNEPILQNSDEKIFTLNDVKHLFLKFRRKIFYAAGIGAIIAFLFVASKPPQYKIEATFQEENEKKGDFFIQNFMGMGTAPAQASTLMKSFQVMKPLIQKLGLQMGVPKERCFLSKVYHRVVDNWRAEKGLVLEDPDSFVFQDVQYEGEKSLVYFIRFEDSSHFTIFDKAINIGSGSLGVEVCLPGLSFTMTKTPIKLILGKSYPLHIQYWISVAQSFRKDLQIKSSKNHQSILDISLFHRDRYLGANILNELMEQYQQYLKRNHDEIAVRQLNYLCKKQGEIYDKMSLMFHEHASYLKQSLESKGIAGLQDEMKTLLIPYHKFQENLLEIDMELAQLNEIEKKGAKGFLGNQSPFFSQHQDFITKIQDLKQQKDLLEISFHSRGFFEQIENVLSDQEEALHSIREQKDRLERLLQVMQRDSSEFSEEICDLKSSLGLSSDWMSNRAKQVDFTQYLVNSIRLLSVQEKIVQEKSFYGKNDHSQFDGIDMDMARGLFAEYNNKLDRAEGLISQYRQLIEKIEENDFEISSLSSILQDPLSQSLILEANKIAVQLKDEKHHSAKEGERWREEIAFQKHVLVDHLQQLCKIEQLNSGLICEKMKVLQQLNLECINREISVLYERMNDGLKGRVESLLQQKKIIEKKMEELRHVSSDFPEKWRQEKWLDLNIDMGLKMIEVMTKLVEEKSVAQHLHHVESKPLDFAVVPLSPRKPNLFMGMVLGSFSAGFGLFFIFLLRAILSGFPTTLDRLKALQYPLLGEVSFLCDGMPSEPATGSDLEFLRQLSLFVESTPQAKIIGLMEGKGPDYSFALAQNLARMSKRSLFFRCDFDKPFHSEDAPGLLQMWNGEVQELPLQKREGFDYVPTGGFTLYGTEMVLSKKFQGILEAVRAEYDLIFVLFRSPLSSVESQAAFKFCEKIIVTVQGEPIEELTPFMKWAYHGKDQRLTFAVSQII